jgi:hypothetical protein
MPLGWSTKFRTARFQHTFGKFREISCISVYHKYKKIIVKKIIHTILQFKCDGSRSAGFIGASDPDLSTDPDNVVYAHKGNSKLITHDANASIR